MKNLTLTILSITLAACATSRTAPSPIPAQAATSGSARQPVTLGAEPTTVSVPTTTDADSLGAEISDDPIVGFVDQLIRNPQDVATSLQINDLWGDKLMKPCTVWFNEPETVARVHDLLGFKGTLTNTVQVLPIKPVGPISGIAEARRVRHDITSGALRTRITAAVTAKRAALDELQTDFALHCGPFFFDMRAAKARFAAMSAGAAVVP